MATLSIPREYADGAVLTATELNDAYDAVETFLNTTKLNDDNLQNSGITGSTKLVNKSVTTAKIDDQAVTTNQIGDLAVTTGKVDNAAITTPKVDTGLINGMTTVSLGAGDFVAIADASDSNKNKKVLASDLIGVDSVKSITFSNSPYTALTTDTTILVDASGGAVTVNLYTAVGNSGRRINLLKTDSSANAVTIDANSTETIQGSLTRVIGSQYQGITIESDNVNWQVIAEANNGMDVELFVNKAVSTSAGHGTTNTHVRRFTTQQKNTLGAFATYTDSATLGGYVTINVSGLYRIAYSDAQTGSEVTIGIVVNGTAGSTNVGSITYAQGLRAIGAANAGPRTGQVSYIGYLNATDVVWAQYDAVSTLNTDDTVIFNVVRLRS